jgi:hypothetical protein
MTTVRAYVTRTQTAEILIGAAPADTDSVRAYIADAAPEDFTAVSSTPWNLETRERGPVPSPALATFALGGGEFDAERLTPAQLVATADEAGVEGFEDEIVAAFRTLAQAVADGRDMTSSLFVELASKALEI